MSNNNNNNKDEEEEGEEEMKSTRPGSKMVSPTAAIVVGLVAGLVAWTAKGWKEVRGFSITVFALFIFFHTSTCNIFSSILLVFIAV